MPKSVLATLQAPDQPIGSIARTNMAEQTPKSTQTNHIRTPAIDTHVTRQTNPIPNPVAQTPISSEGTSQTNVSVDKFV